MISIAHQRGASPRQNKSRYDSISCYIHPTSQSHNDIPCETDEEVRVPRKQRLFRLWLPDVASSCRCGTYEKHPITRPCWTVCLSHHQTINTYKKRKRPKTKHRNHGSYKDGVASISSQFSLSKPYVPDKRRWQGASMVCQSNHK